MRIFAAGAFQTSCNDSAWRKAFPSNQWYRGRLRARRNALKVRTYRKHVLEYDDLMNKQREAIYGLRRQLLEGETQKEYIIRMNEIMVKPCRAACPSDSLPGQWDLAGCQ